jgi:NitT/TauT family transport system permease protein
MKSKYALTVFITVTGFCLALAVSLFFPTVQADIDDTAYRFTLAGIIALFVLTAVISFANEKRRAKFMSRAPFRLAMGMVLLIWDVASAKTGALPLPFFPSPSKILSVFVIDRDFMIENILFSLRLYFAGFVSGTVLGVGTGILIGWFKKVNYWVFPLLKMTGVIPAVAWIPIALTLLKSGFLTGTFLITMCAWFPIGFQTANGMQSTQRLYFEVAETLGGSNAWQLFHVALPNALPSVFTGISTANGLAFTTLVISEMLGAKGGLGYYINWAKAWAEYYKVYAAIIVMAVMFSLILALINLIKNRALAWRRGLVSNVDDL